MVKNDRAALSRSLGAEALETRNLLSTLIGSKPTIDALDGPGVSHKFGGISIVQPAVIQVFGTAQPGSPNSTVSVGIYAEDSEGNLVNGGAPLATTTPDILGRYHADVSLPSQLRADVNYLVARETASAVETFQVAVNATTESGLTGTLATPANTLTDFGGSLTTPSTPISNLAGTISIATFPIGTGTGGPAIGTLLGGSGTLGAQVGTITGGSGTIGATSGTLTQTGSAAIAATTGTATALDQEVATSDPLVVLIHQPKKVATVLHVAAKSHTSGIVTAVSHAKAIHAARAHKAK